MAAWDNSPRISSLTLASLMWVAFNMGLLGAVSEQGWIQVLFMGGIGSGMQDDIVHVGHQVIGVNYFCRSH